MQNRGVTFNRYRVLLWEGEKVLEVDRNAGYMKVEMHLMPRNYMFRNGYDSKYVYFATMKNKYFLKEKSP